MSLFLNLVSGYKVMFYYGLIFIFLMINDIEYFSCIYYPLFRETSKSCAKFLVGLFVLLLTCESPLCVLGTHPLLDMQSENIFSHSVGCLFISLVKTYEPQKV